MYLRRDILSLMLDGIIRYSTTSGRTNGNIAWPVHSGAGFSFNMSRTDCSFLPSFMKFDLLHYGSISYTSKAKYSRHYRDTFPYSAKSKFRKK